MHQLRFSPSETLVVEGTEVQQFIVVFSGDVVGTHRCEQASTQAAASHNHVNGALVLASADAFICVLRSS